MFNRYSKAGGGFSYGVLGDFPFPSSHPLFVPLRVTPSRDEEKSKETVETYQCRFSFIEES